MESVPKKFTAFSDVENLLYTEYKRFIKKSRSWLTSPYLDYIQIRRYRV